MRFAASISASSASHGSSRNPGPPQINFRHRSWSNGLRGVSRGRVDESWAFSQSSKSLRFRSLSSGDIPIVVTRPQSIFSVRKFVSVPMVSTA